MKPIDDEEAPQSITGLIVNQILESNAQWLDSQFREAYSNQTGP